MQQEICILNKEMQNTFGGWGGYTSFPQVFPSVLITEDRKIFCFSMELFLLYSEIQYANVCTKFHMIGAQKSHFFLNLYIWKLN